jgi:hypothetical protein
VNRSWYRSLARVEHRTAMIVIAIAVVMVSLFVASYTLALGRPMPHHVPVAVVGDPAQQPALVAALEAATHDAMELHPYPSAAAAQAAIDDRIVCAALVVDSGRPQFMVSSATSSSVARLLELTAMQVSQGLDTPIEIYDVHPLPASDPQGLAAFYVTLGATIVGFLTMFQLRANAPQLRLSAWLAYLAVIAVVGGLSLTLVTGPLLGALPGPFAEIWAALSAQIAVTALFCSAMLVLIGRWAIIPTWLVFVALGNAASGGAVAPVLLPPVYAFVGRFLPTGATVNIVHAAVYFRDTQRLEPFLVQAGWLAGCLAALLVLARSLHREPAGQ